MSQAMLETSITRENPRPVQPVARNLPLSLTYTNKQLALYNRIKSRIRALKYHYDRINLLDDTLYFSHLDILTSASIRLVDTNFICNDSYKISFARFFSLPNSTTAKYW